MHKIFFILLVFFSCSKSEKKVEISILLKKKHSESPLLVRLVPFNFYDSISSDFKGLAVRDSTLLGYIPLVDLYENERNKFLAEENKIEFKNDFVTFYALTGFKDGKQYYILDTNFNKDFNDDNIHLFNKKTSNLISENIELRDSFPQISLKIARSFNKDSYDEIASIRVFPNKNYFYFPNSDNTFNLKKELTLVSSTNDFYEGNFNVYDKKYKVAQGYGLSEINLIFSKENEEYATFANPMREIYTMLDTIELEDRVFKIQFGHKKPHELVLEELTLNTPYYGFRTGQTTKDFVVEDLVGNSFKLSQALGSNHELLLLDFWGTWCAPCKELTPDLVELYKKHGDKVEFLSLAFEENTTPVKEYVTKNNMTWIQGFIKGVPKSAQNKPMIIKNLRITAYPTFILLDKNNQIVFRGTGSNFKLLPTYIEKYLNNKK